VSSSADTTTPDRCMTPPALAQRWGCKPSTILTMLRRGELRGFTLGRGRRRPRWRISPEAVAAYEAGRPPAPAKTRRRKKDSDLIEFF